jgi:predicted nucleic acid-binding protein
VDDLLADMESLALHVRPMSIATTNLPDPDDAPFIATALAAACPIVTGNARHFPADCGVEILSPAQFFAHLIG